MITAAFAAALAALAVAAAPAAEPPPPPYQWDATPVPFKPFYAFVHRSGGTESITWSVNPQEGRDVCAWKQQYDELGPLNCLVMPMKVDENGNQVITFDQYGLVEFPDGPPAIEIVFN